MLVHHTDSIVQGRQGIGDLDFLSLKENLSLLRLLMTEQDLHQRTFSGSVFTHQRMDFTLFYGKIYILIGHKAVAVNLCDMFHG